MKTLNIVFLIILVIIVIAAGGYFGVKYYLFQNNNASVHPRLARFFNVPVPLPPPPSPTKGWSTYDNFGIEFQYPNSKAWGLPQESILSLSPQIVFSTASSTPFFVSIMAYNSIPGVTDFDQWIAKSSGLMSNVSAGGLEGKEFVVSNKDGSSTFFAYFPLNDQTFISFNTNSEFTTKQNFDTLISTFKTDNSTQITTDPANKNYVYNNGDITFEYPAIFGSNYASLNVQTILARPGNGNINIRGCYETMGATGKASAEKAVTINNVKFCMTTGSDVGAGQLYNSYYYTAFHNGYYYAIGYVVHVPNGCDNYMGTPNYQPCLSAQKNYNTAVAKPIQASANTIKFIN